MVVILLWIAQVNFLLSSCSLMKEYDKRPLNYTILLSLPFLSQAEQNKSLDMAAYISKVLDDLPAPPPEKSTDR